MKQTSIPRLELCGAQLLARSIKVLHILCMPRDSDTSQDGGRSERPSRAGAQSSSVTTGQSSNMRKALKQKILETVSTLRALFINIKVSGDKKKVR